MLTSEKIRKAATDYHAEVVEVGAKTVTLKGQGHAALRAGLSVPMSKFPAPPKKGDEFFATWKPGPHGGEWSFSPMEF